MRSKEEIKHKLNNLEREERSEMLRIDCSNNYQANPKDIKKKYIHIRDTLKWVLKEW